MRRSAALQQRLHRRLLLLYYGGFPRWMGGLLRVVRGAAVSVVVLLLLAAIVPLLPGALQAHVLALLLHGHLHADPAVAWTHDAAADAASLGMCSLERCFDFARPACAAALQDHVLPVYVYPRDVTRLERLVRELGGAAHAHVHDDFDARVVAALRNHSRVRVVQHARDACLLVVRGFCFGGSQCDAWEGMAAARLRALPHWGRDGANHIVFDHENSECARAAADKAIYVRTASHQAFVRPGFDVQLPLFPRSAPPLSSSAVDQLPPPNQRRLLLSFKGTRCLLSPTSSGHPFFPLFSLLIFSSVMVAFSSFNTSPAFLLWLQAQRLIPMVCGSGWLRWTTGSTS